MRRAEDPREALAAGGVMLRVVALCLAGFHGGYTFMLIQSGESLWALPIYDAARAMPGGILTWVLISGAAFILLLAGTLLRREGLVAIGSGLSALWLTFFSACFLASSIGDPSPLGRPGVLVYGCIAIIAAARLGVALGRR